MGVGTHDSTRRGVTGGGAICCILLLFKRDRLTFMLCLMLYFAKL